jgi:hypothetical protein
MFQWDEACDLIGGTRYEDVLDHWRSRGLDADRYSALSSLTSEFFSSLRLPHQRGALAVLWVKWNLFTSLCRSVLASYGDLKQPHLGLNPTRVWVRWSPLSQHEPAARQFSVEVRRDGAASPLACNGMPEEMARSLFTPPLTHASLYTSPVIQDWPLGRDVPVTVLIQSIDKIQEETAAAVRGILRLQLIADAFAQAAFSERDVFRVILRSSRAGCEPISVWCRKIESAERGIVVSGVTDPLSSALWTGLEECRQEVFSHAQALVYRAFDASSDFYSIGMLLAHALLVNRHQDLQHVKMAFDRIIRGLDPMVTGVDPQDHVTMHQRIAARLKEEGSVFRSSSIVFDEKQDQAGVVPDDIWYDALIMVLRLASAIPGFSVGAMPGGQPTTRMSAQLERFVGAAECLGERIRMDLFGDEQRSREILQVCQAVRTELMGMGRGSHAH